MEINLVRLSQVQMIGMIFHSAMRFQRVLTTCTAGPRGGKCCGWRTKDKWNAILATPDKLWQVKRFPN